MRSLANVAFAPRMLPSKQIFRRHSIIEFHWLNARWAIRLGTSPRKRVTATILNIQIPIRICMSVATTYHCIAAVQLPNDA